MVINPETKLYALMGDPVAHSLSPVIHNTFYETEGVNAIYSVFRVKRGDTENALKGGVSLGIEGFNVTVPHKEAVLPYIAAVDEAAKAIGAVNTLKLTEEGYKGYNTDFLGIKRQIEELKIDLKGKKAIMIGAGGAANAVLYALYDMGSEGVYILNRSPEKARDKFGDDSRNIILPLNEYEKIPGKGYFCVQCTSVGLFPDVDSAPIEDPAFYEKIDDAVDIVYNPADTAFMKKVRAAGGRAENGLDMLLYQAAEGFKIFTGKPVSDKGIEEARHKLREALWEG